MTESFTLFLFFYPHFLCTTCIALWLFVLWKRCGREVMSRSHFTCCPSGNTAFRQTWTRQKGTRKSRKHLLRRASDSQFFFAGVIFFVVDKFHLRWQVPLDKLVSFTSWLDKLTWQVDLSPCPLAPLQFAGQVDLSSQLEQSSYHASVGPWILWRKSTHQKIAVIVDWQSWSPITAKSAHGVAHRKAEVLRSALWEWPQHACLKEGKHKRLCKQGKHNTRGRSMRAQKHAA